MDANIFQVAQTQLAAGSALSHSFCYSPPPPQLAKGRPVAPSLTRSLNMRSLLSLSLVGLLSHACSTHALTFPVRAQSRADDRPAAGTLSARAGNGNTILSVRNVQNSEYSTNISLGGREIPVLLDTGRYVPRDPGSVS